MKMKKILLSIVALWATWSVSADSAAKEETDKLPLLAVAVSDGQALVKILLARAASSSKAFNHSFDFAATFLDGRKVAVRGSVASVSETLPSRVQNILRGTSSKKYVVSVLLGSVRASPFRHKFDVPEIVVEPLFTVTDVKPDPLGNLTDVINVECGFCGRLIVMAVCDVLFRYSLSRLQVTLFEEKVVTSPAVL